MKYIKNIKIIQSGWESGKPRFSILNKSDNSLLGTIEYYPNWRQYIFDPYARTIYSFDCLMDIANFIKEKNEST